VAMLALGIGPAPLVWLLDCIRGAHLDHGDLHRFSTYGQVLAPDKVHTTATRPGVTMPSYDLGASRDSADDPGEAQQWET